MVMMMTIMTIEVTLTAAPGRTPQPTGTDTIAGQGCTQPMIKDGDDDDDNDDSDADSSIRPEATAYRNRHHYRPRLHTSHDQR